MTDKYFIRPVFRVRDVGASVAYYCEKLGCRRRWDHGADGPIIAEVERGDLSVILDSESVVPKPAGPSVLTMSVENLGELHRELVGRGANIVTPLFEDRDAAEPAVAAAPVRSANIRDSYSLNSTRASECSTHSVRKSHAVQVFPMTES